MEYLICQYCGKECKNKNSLIQHEIRCKLNPNKINMDYMLRSNHIPHALGHKGANQFTKAKENNQVYQVSEETRIKCGQIFKGKHHSEKTKQILREKTNKWLEGNPDKIGWIMNHSSKKSYPEQYFEELFIQENIPLQYHKHVGKYELDFYNDNLMKYVEIDGHQHYDNQFMIEHDKERTEFLKKLGWIGIRINWSKYQKLNKTEKISKIQEIKQFLK